MRAWMGGVGGCGGGVEETGIMVGRVGRGSMALMPRCQDPTILHKEEGRRSSAWLQIEQEGKLLKNKDRK
jgi:hypothetical protein